MEKTKEQARLNEAQLRLCGTVGILTVLFSTLFSEWLERALGQFFEYEDITSVIMLTVVFILTLFIYEWKIMYIEKCELGYTDDNEIGSTTRAKVIADVAVQVATLTSSSVITRVSIRFYSLHDPLAFMGVSAVFTITSFFYYRFMVKYLNICNLNDISRTKKTITLNYIVNGPQQSFVQ
jgi:magnesium-transporting ATPase (P-type)